MYSSAVLSLPLQQETGTEIIRSQGTIGFSKRRRRMEVTVAQASSSVIWILGVTGPVLLP